MGPVFFTIFSLAKRLPITAGRTRNSRRRTREDARGDRGFYSIATLLEPIYCMGKKYTPPQFRSSMDFFLRRSAYRELMTGRGDASIGRRRSKSWPPTRGGPWQGLARGFCEEGCTVQNTGPEN